MAKVTKKQTGNQKQTQSASNTIVIECSEFCVAGDRESYKTTGCAGGFYPECQGKKRWYSCTASRI
jgi:hypothetical protein